MISRKTEKCNSEEKTQSKQNRARQSQIDTNPILVLQKTVGNQAAQGILQAKLMLGQPGDRFEQEADENAEKIKSCSAENGMDFKHNADARVSRKPSGTYKGAEAPAIVHEALNSNGQSLDHSTKTIMEAYFGSDFGSVRIHNDSKASESARSINALAYTVGRDIVFGAGQYTPATNSGRSLIAHELTHVVQQAGTESNTTVQREMDGGMPNTSDDLDAGVPKGNEYKGGQTAGWGNSDWSVDNNTIKYKGTVTISTDADSVRKQLEAGYAENGKDWLNTLLRSLESEIQNESGNLSDMNGVTEEMTKTQERLSIEQQILPILTQQVDGLYADIDRLGQLFKEDIKNKAMEYLLSNRNKVMEEIENQRLDQDNKAVCEQGPADKKKVQIEELKKMAHLIASAQEKQEKLRKIPVGYDFGSIFPTTFNPGRKPAYKPYYGDTQCSDWETVNQYYLKLSGIIAVISNQNPAIYSMVRENKIQDFDRANPEEAAGIANGTLNNLLINIDKAAEKIMYGELDPLDLKPIHDSFFQGGASPSGTMWNQSFNQRVAQEELEHHQTVEFWVNLGLTTLAAAAFIFAEIASGGTATLLFAAGAGIGAAQAAESWKEYGDMKAVSDAKVDDEHDIIDQGSVDAKKVEAIINTIGVAIDVLAPALKVGMEEGAIKGAGELVERGSRFDGDAKVVEAYWNEYYAKVGQRGDEIGNLISSAQKRTYGNGNLLVEDLGHAGYNDGRIAVGSNTKRWEFIEEFLHYKVDNNQAFSAVRKGIQKDLKMRRIKSVGRVSEEIAVKRWMLGKANLLKLDEATQTLLKNQIEQLERYGLEYGY